MQNIIHYYSDEKNEYDPYLSRIYNLYGLTEEEKEIIRKS